MCKDFIFYKHYIWNFIPVLALKDNQKTCKKYGIILFVYLKVWERSRDIKW